MKQDKDQRYVIDTAENRAFLKEMRDGLLRFGHAFAAPDGSSYYLGDDGTPWTERARETWITSRMLHVYSIGCILGHAGSGALADQALRGLRGVLHDEKNGGWYAGITADGQYLPTKQCYAHAFVILAATSAYLAGRNGARALLDEALATYDRYFWDDEKGLACDTWNTEFTELDDYRGLNANMHTVEAFLAVADAIGAEDYRVRAGRIIDHVIGWAEENDDRIPEHFTKDWVADLDCNIEKPDDPFKPYGATPGHGIEWARLICQWAVSARQGAERERYIRMAERLYRRAVADAWHADGADGIVYTTDWNGKPIVHDRMHWTLAEAINTSAVLYRLTEDPHYAEDYGRFMEYLDRTVYDHTNGSWYHQLDENNRLTGTVWAGKSDIYHALQATLIPYSDAAVSIAAAQRRTHTDVVALGELLIDFTENGVSANGNPLLEANAGGAPCNVLAMLQKLGRQTAFIGKVGKDAFGAFLTDAVRSCGIDTSNLIQDGTAHTTLAFVHTAPDGDRSFSFYRDHGADTLLTEQEIDYEKLGSAKLFHFGTLSMTHEGVRAATKRAVAYAKEHGLLISFDPNYRPLLWKDAQTAKEMMAYGFSQCDILKISDDEILFFTGKETIGEAVDVFLSQYRPKLLCLTLGKEGSIAYYGTHCVRAAAMRRDDTIETTGAGDTFMACVLDFVLEHGLDGLTEAALAEMLDFAGTAAALITTRKGALKVMPDLEEIESARAQAGM